MNAHTLGTEAQVKPLMVRYPLDHNAVGVFHGGRTCAARDRRACRDGCVNSVDVRKLRQVINGSRSGVSADTDLHDRQTLHLQTIPFAVKYEGTMAPSISNAHGNRSA